MPLLEGVDRSKLEGYLLLKWPQNRGCALLQLSFFFVRFSQCFYLYVFRLCLLRCLGRFAFCFHVPQRVLALEGLLMSRVGDRPTATILHAQFHCFDFCFWFFKQNIQPKYAPPRKGKYKVNTIGGAASPPLHFKVQLVLLGGAYFGRIFCFKKQNKIKKMKLHLQNCSSWSISHS